MLPQLGVERLSFLSSYIFWLRRMEFLGPFVYHRLVLVLVQEFLAVSVISFEGLCVAQLFGYSLILQELSVFFNVF